ncbi:PilN domain-containing protein [Neptuniibacter halophilus]|uniref:PilN domain-containing protein n=1 Tax=Neptuniibacter halophilus TaxID=651666 RepID=UPI00257365C3|nr:PilN domain-containing protein [Neptuniibacter halophilus]
MATINLRPWREELAQKRQKDFLTNLLVSAIIAALIVFGIGYYFDFMKQRQMDRNNFLRAETSKLDKQIAEIRKLKEQRARLLDRLNAIQELQGTRPLIVRNFDELVRVLPDAVYYRSLTRRGDTVAITGLAEENLDVSSLMRNLDQSIWFGEPNLSGVGKAGADANSFNLTVPVTKPKAEAAK